MKQKILITGGAGFIPSCLAQKLATNSNFEIVLLDNLLTGKLSNIPDMDNVTFIKADVNIREDLFPIMLSNNFDYVFHYAAVVGVKRTQDNPVMVLKDIDGIKSILNLSKSTGVKRVFYSSSSEVYGEPVELPQHEETTPLNSRVPYAVVKNLGEAFLRVYKHEFDLPYTILRFFNTYGINQSEDFVISKFIKAAINNSDITIYGDGSQTRTFCYIDDNTEFTEKILLKNLFVNEVVNVGHHKQYQIIDLAKLIIELTGSNSKIIYLPKLKDGDMTRRQPDNNKMIKTLERDLIDLRSGLLKILKRN